MAFFFFLLRVPLQFSPLSKHDLFVMTWSDETNDEQVRNPNRGWQPWRTFSSSKWAGEPAGYAGRVHGSTRDGANAAAQ